MKKFVIATSIFVSLQIVIQSASALELEKAIIAAEENDPTLASARANRDAAAENIDIARSRLFPQISAQGSYSRNQQDINQTNTQGQSSNRQQNVNSLNSSVSLRQGLLRPRDWLGLSIGELQAEYGLQKLMAAQSDLWFRVVAAWVDVLAASENYKTQLLAVDSTHQAAEQARRRFSAGDSTKDVQNEASAQHFLAKAQLSEAEQTLKAKQLSYRLLTGLELNLVNKKLPAHQDLKLPLTLNDLLLRTLNKNGEILSLRLAEQINQQRIKQASSDHLPTIDLVSSYTKAESDTINTIGTQYTTKSIGVQVVIPIFSGGGLSASERQQSANYRASIADRQAMEIRLETQINLDWASYLSGFDRVSAAQELVKAAKDQKRSYQLGLKSGVKTWGDIAQADMLLARRQQEYIGHASNFFKNQARLLSNIPSSDDEWIQWVKLMSHRSE